MKLKMPLIYFLLFFFVTAIFFHPFFLKGRLPIPSDTIVGLYHPYRDLLAKEYPRGLPFKNFQITDPVRQQYPWKTLAIDALKRGELPLWNPYNFSGTPLLANFQAGVLYPLNILFFLLPFHLGWSLFIFSQPLLAMIFMYFYLKNLRLSSPASILGSISFAFCGFSVSWMEWGNVVSTGLWLPLVLLAIDKIVVSIRNKNIFLWSLVFVLSLTFSFFAGHLQIFFYLFVISFLYFLARWLYSGKKTKTLFVFLILNTLFLILTAVQWITTLRFILESARNLDQTWHNPGWFLPFQNLTQFIAPDFFGNPSTLNYWGVWNYGEFIGYIGLIPLIFSLYAVIFYKRKIVWFFLSIFLLSLIFALPTIFAKLPFKFDLPFLSTSQPTRLIYLADVSLAILAAFGLEYFLKNKKKIFVPLFIIGAFIASFWGFVFFNQQLPVYLHTEEINLAVTKNNLKLPTLLFGVAVFIFAFYLFSEKRFKYTKKLLLTVIIVITVFDLYRFTSKYITFAEQKYLFPDTKILSYLQKDNEPFRIISADSRVFPPNFSIMYKLQTLDGYDPLFTKRYAELSAAIGRDQPNINPPFGFNRIITIQNHQSSLINLLNVKYVLSITDLDPTRFKKIMTEGETRLYENFNVFPRAFFVEKVMTVENKQEAINALFDRKVNLKLTAVTEGYSNKEKFDRGKVTKINYSENRVVINTNTKNEGFLVLTDSFYPTWHAKICDDNMENCKESKIYLTNYNFRGIIVPSGNHSIEFYNTLL